MADPQPLIDGDISAPNMLFRLVLTVLQKHMPDASVSDCTWIAQEIEKMVFPQLDRLEVLLHEVTTLQGLYATDRPITQLLEDFWQRTSDACPLEDEAHEQEIIAFENWAGSISWRIGDAEEE